MINYCNAITAYVIGFTDFTNAALLQETIIRIPNSKVNSEKIKCMKTDKIKRHLSTDLVGKHIPSFVQAFSDENRYT